MTAEQAIHHAEACRHSANMELGAYPITNRLLAAEYLRAAETFEREAQRLERKCSKV